MLIYRLQDEKKAAEVVLIKSEPMPDYVPHVKGYDFNQGAVVCLLLPPPAVVCLLLPTSCCGFLVCYRFCNNVTQYLCPL